MSTALDEIKKLDAKREQLLKDAVAQARATADAAIADLNALGFACSLAVGKSQTTRTVPTGTRRAGIRDDVLTAITNAGPDGISSAGIRSVVGADGKAGAGEFDILQP